jgi:hypothetical protein
MSPRGGYPWGDSERSTFKLQTPTHPQHSLLGHCLSASLVPSIELDLRKVTGASTNVDTDTSTAHAAAHMTDALQTESCIGQN